MIGEPTGATWGPARQRLAAIAVLTAILTAAAGAALGGSGGYVRAAGGYTAIAIAALFSPTWIVVQVIAGQAIAGSLLLGSDGAAPLMVLPIVAGVVATAELLAAAGRLDTPLDRVSRGEFRRAGIAAAIGAAVFAAVVHTVDLPGPTGLIAIVLSSAACVVLAILLAVRHSTGTAP